MKNPTSVDKTMCRAAEDNMASYGLTLQRGSANGRADCALVEVVPDGIDGGAAGAGAGAGVAGSGAVAELDRRICTPLATALRAFGWFVAAVGSARARRICAAAAAAAAGRGAGARPP